ncbi:MAG: DNA replication terminus site-binding protein, partial [Methylohalobius sp.]|nr:DNA replication terminus site-binding protein [Methylohalobius sp.]
VILKRFRVQLEQETLPAWTFDLTKQEYYGIEARRRLVLVLEQLEYQDDRDGRETEICPGIFGASPSLLKLSARLNIARDRFKSAVLEANRKDPDAAREVLKNHGFPRVHFKQIYRHFPILLKKPHSVRFTWGATRSIKKISKQEAYRRLTLLAGDSQSLGFQRQFEALSALRANEPIAIVQDLKPHIKANVCWVKRDVGDKEVIRKLISAALPILIPLDAGESLPEHSAAYPDERKPRKSRADTKIEAEPFLPSIRGHRYLLK